jgi:hypothetical protein
MKTIEQHAVRPRLRRGYLWFGLLAATTATQVVTHYALCNRDGSPACGNIGQAGSLRPITISVAQTLVAPPPNANEPVARPVVDAQGQVVCGNVMSKGGCR